jgi:hypothetical protein
VVFLPSPCYETRNAQRHYEIQIKKNEVAEVGGPLKT